MTFEVVENLNGGLYFLNGKRTTFKTRSTFPVYEPRNGQVVAQCPIADEACVNNYVNTAHSAQSKWANLTPSERSAILIRAGNLALENLEKIAIWEVKTNGKSITETREDITSSADTLIFYGGILRAATKGDYYDLPINGEEASRFAYTRRQPFGVVGCIGAWNYPFQTACWKIAPALAAGNAVVYKPSPFAPASPVLLGELLTSAGLPDGVYNVCTNATRVYVHQSIVEEFTENLLKQMEKVRIGDPLEESTNVGATINEEHLKKVLGYVERALQEILRGGKRVQPEGVENGFYFDPAVLTNLNDDSEIVKEEIFGAVLLILPFGSEEEVVQRVNHTTYGLASGLYTKCLARAHRVAAKIEAGTIFINTYNDTEVHVPFGGFKNSGHGRENCVEALQAYTQIKAVYVNISKEKLQHHLA